MIDITFNDRVISEFIGNIGPKAKKELKFKIAGIMAKAYDLGVQTVNQKLHTTKQEYLDGFDLEETPRGGWKITLDESVDYLEEGYDQFNLSAAILANPDNDIQVSKETGARYKRMLIDKTPKGLEAKAGLYTSKADVVKRRAIMGEATRVRKAIRESGLDKTYRHPSYVETAYHHVGTDKEKIIREQRLGKPITGQKGLGKLVDQIRNKKGSKSKIAGLAKFQKKGEGGRTASAYGVFRTVSDMGKDWIHPGFGGVHAFDKMTSFIFTELTKVLRNLSLKD